MAEPGKVRGLVDEDGCFYADADVVSERARPEEVYIELRAQVEMALAAGMKPTHVDTHMFALFYNDALYSVNRQLAQECGLAFLVPSGPSFFETDRTERGNAGACPVHGAPGDSSSGVDRRICALGECAEGLRDADKLASWA